jgi:hypothetical protein
MMQEVAPVSDPLRDACLQRSNPSSNDDTSGLAGSGDRTVRATGDLPRTVSRYERDRRREPASAHSRDYPVAETEPSAVSVTEVNFPSRWGFAAAASTVDLCTNATGT